MKKIRLLAGVLLALGGAAHAQDHPHGPPPGGREAGMHAAPERAAPLHLDARYHHDHYYPPRGYAVGGVPVGGVNVNYRGGRYYFHGGVWFRPEGGRYVVVAPPFGIVVPLLPPAATTVWLGGGNYYYANGTYYLPAADGTGYTVVAPPPGADTSALADDDAGDAPPPDADAVALPVPPSRPPAPGGGPVPPAAPPAPIAAAPMPELIFYPRNAQTPVQTESDRRACNGWAATQPNAVADASVFQRAVAACMDGRGYTVR
jgi:hypothetical protein